MSEWIETGQGNRISKYATISGSNNIVLAGHCVISAGCVVDGREFTIDTDKETSSDFSISIGRYCIFENSTRVKPPVIGYKKEKNNEKKTSICRPILINSFVWIGSKCRIECELIGSWVLVGTGSKLSRCCKIGDVIIIDSNVDIPENYQVPSYSRVSRNDKWPNSITIKPLSVTMRKMIENWCVYRYLGAECVIDDEDFRALFPSPFSAC